MGETVKYPFHFHSVTGIIHQYQFDALLKNGKTVPKANALTYLHKSKLYWVKIRRWTLSANITQMAVEKGIRQ